MLEIMLSAGDCAVVAHSTSEIDAAQFLAAEGWLRSTGVDASAYVYRIALPLVRSVALAELAKKATIAAPLPLGADKQLAFPDVITASLQLFKPAVMRAAAGVSPMVSAASVEAPGVGVRVPSEAAYHAQLARVLSTWLRVRGHTDVFNVADSSVLAAGSRSAGVKRKKLYADILLVGEAAGAPKHVLEMAASASDGEIAELYGRTVAHMAAHSGARRACVTFTAVVGTADVAAIKPDALAWPTRAQLDAGLVAIHVVHDLRWTTAAVHSMKAVRGQAAA